MFWGNEILRTRLPQLVSDYSEQRLDRGTYRLRIGSEVYVSPTGEPGDSINKPKTILSPGQGFTIPAGQFAYLLSYEKIDVPDDALAFISVRARYKLRGLVNVSGFHVDPGYSGRLIFAVFNAGPAPVHLTQGEECFHIWYASVEGSTELPPKVGHEIIPSEIINLVSGKIESFAGLDSKIKEAEKKLDKRIADIEKDHRWIRWAALLAISLVAGLIVKEVGVPRLPQNAQPRQEVVQPPESKKQNFSPTTPTK